MSIIAWTETGWEDYRYWHRHDRRKLKRINDLLKDIGRTPFSGRGRPEPLRFDLTGYWSRRIDQEHRLVYSWNSEADTICVVQCRMHY
ncbi:MAG TPA: Txe/YoeB family addiction module toxin [Desulfomicrobiaceae bacterium]|nr:Txe/YoeB family addiction module toxin [Desulfomicrobiaceae bacterium]